MNCFSITTPIMRLHRRFTPPLQSQSGRNHPDLTKISVSQLFQRNKCGEHEKPRTDTGLTFSIRSQMMALLKYSMLVHSMPCNKCISRGIQTFVYILETDVRCMWESSAQHVHFQRAPHLSPLPSIQVLQLQRHMLQHLIFTWA